MSFTAKLLQAAGLATVLIGFVQRFPEPMSLRLFLLGLGSFFLGWLVDRFLPRRTIDRGGRATGKASSKSKSL